MREEMSIVRWRNIYGQQKSAILPRDAAKRLAQKIEMHQHVKVAVIPR